MDLRRASWRKREPAAVPERLARFADLVRREDDDVPLAEASLEIARDADPSLDVTRALDRLHAMAMHAAEHDPGRSAPLPDRLRALSRFLFEDEGFRGHEEVGLDAGTAYLNAVLDRRAGLPISLSVIYLEIGWSLGLPLAGVGLPLHFIVRALEEAAPDLFVDPFHGGGLIDAEGCRTLLREVSGGKVELQPEHLRPWSKKRILERMLQNLKGIYLRQREPRLARRVVDLILVMRPEAASEIRDRGMLAYQCLLFEQALEDLERYLVLEPRSRDATAIRGQVQSLRRLMTSPN